MTQPTGLYIYDVFGDTDINNFANIEEITSDIILKMFTPSENYIVNKEFNNRLQIIIHYGNNLPDSNTNFLTITFMDSGKMLYKSSAKYSMINDDDFTKNISIEPDIFGVASTNISKFNNKAATFTKNEYYRDNNNLMLDYGIKLNHSEFYILIGIKTSTTDNTITFFTGVNNTIQSDTKIAQKSNGVNYEIRIVNKSPIAVEDNKIYDIYHINNNEKALLERGKLDDKANYNLNNTYITSEDGSKKIFPAPDETNYYNFYLYPSLFCKEISILEGKFVANEGRIQINTSFMLLLNSIRTRFNYTYNWNDKILTNINSDETYYSQYLLMKNGFFINIQVLTSNGVNKNVFIYRMSMVTGEFQFIKLDKSLNVVGLISTNNFTIFVLDGGALNLRTRLKLIKFPDNSEMEIKFEGDSDKENLYIFYKYKFFRYRHFDWDHPLRIDSGETKLLNGEFEEIHDGTIWR